jgi:hypothetical protein
VLRSYIEGRRAVSHREKEPGMSDRQQSTMMRWLCAIAAWCVPSRRPRGAALAEDENLPAGAPAPVRSAGPEAMRDPPAEWNSVDQASDESFPASDPPSR